MRSMSSDKKVKFTKKGHTYNKGDKKYISVSQIIGKYKAPFDKQHWSRFSALRTLLGNKYFFSLAANKDIKDSKTLDYIEGFVNKKDLIDSKNTILNEWKYQKDKSIKKGNKYHDAKEKLSIERGYETNPFTGKKVTTRAVSYTHLTLPTIYSV